MPTLVFLVLALGCTPDTAPPAPEAAAPVGTEPASMSTVAPEVCNGIDDDLDGLIDDEDPDLVDPLRLYADIDGDGFGDPEDSILACKAPGRVTDGTDCNDAAATVHPGAADSCDGHVDNDCDGRADPSESDRDGDGITPCGGDCDDSDPEVSPHALERCDGRDTDCDGAVDLDDPDAELSSCGWCPPADEREGVPIHVETYNPCVLDPDVAGLCYVSPYMEDTHEQGLRLHRVAWREDRLFRRQLFLFLPPGAGGEAETIPSVAAYAGFRTISLGYVNDIRLNTACGFEHPDPNPCYDDARYEILFGEDRSDVYDVGPADAALERLRVLLRHLADTQPDMGWDDYLTPDGNIRWEDVVLAGWSAGSGNTAYLSGRFPVHGALLMSGPQDIYEGPGLQPLMADWLMEPRATPGCMHWGAYHLLDRVDLLSDIWDTLGIPAGESDIDRGSAPYDGRQRLTSEIILDRCDAHMSMGRDGCVREQTKDAYLHAMCEVAAQRPEDCTD